MTLLFPASSIFLVVGLDSVSGSTKMVTRLCPVGSCNTWQPCESDSREVRMVFDNLQTTYFQRTWPYVLVRSPRSSRR